LHYVDKYDMIVDEMTTFGLAESILNSTSSKILRVLVLDSDEPVHLRELARRAGLDPMAVHREMKKLVSSGIVMEKKSGNQRLFALDKRCPIYNELRMIVIKTMGIADEIRRALESIKDKIKFAYIYGSFASGEFRNDSDVDVLIATDLTLFDLVKILSPIQEKLSREINPTVFTEKEYFSRLKEGSGFISNIHRGEKIMIVGEINESWIRHC